MLAILGIGVSLIAMAVMMTAYSIALFPRGSWTGEDVERLLIELFVMTHAMVIGAIVVGAVVLSRG